LLENCVLFDSLLVDIVVLGVLVLIATASPVSMLLQGVEVYTAMVKALE
jgi:hypothetical protein